MSTILSRSNVVTPRVSGAEPVQTIGLSDMKVPSAVIMANVLQNLRYEQLVYKKYNIPD